MAYIVNQYDGTLVTTVEDKTVDTTTLSIKLVGRAYAYYGEVIAENLVHMLEHFAGPNPPAGTYLPGQIWYDTADRKIKVWDGSEWLFAGGVRVVNTTDDVNSPSSGVPAGIIDGELLWNEATEQLHGWSDASSDWILIGPVSPKDANTEVEYSEVQDGSGGTHRVLVVKVDDRDIAVWSKDPFAPQAGGGLDVSDFPEIHPGLTFSKHADGYSEIHSGHHIPLVTNTYDLGTPTKRWKTIHAQTVVVDNLQQTGQPLIPFDKFMRTDRTNLPDSNNTFDLGGTINRYSTVYATTFDGTATSARYADLAERFRTSESVGPGDLVRIGGKEEISKTIRDCDENVFGVISTNPAFRMNDKAGSDDEFPFVAEAGRVPCRVVGKVKKGQRLVASSIPGVARGVTDSELSSVPWYCVFGRSLGDKNIDDVDLVEVIVGGK